MPRVKFSDFSVETTVNDSHYVLGYYGTSNKRWTMQTIKNYLSIALNIPYNTATQSIPANTPSGAWYRIATSISGVYRCDGIFEVEYLVGGYHQRVSFRASSMFNTDNSIQIVKMGGSKFANDSPFVIQSVRVVYYPEVYGGAYA